LTGEIGCGDNKSRRVRLKLSRPLFGCRRGFNYVGITQFDGKTPRIGDSADSRCYRRTPP